MGVVEVVAVRPTEGYDMVAAIDAIGCGVTKCGEGMLSVDLRTLGDAIGLFILRRRNELEIPSEEPFV